MTFDWPDKQREGSEDIDVILPPSKGMMLTGSPLNLLEDYSADLLNCYYNSLGQLIIGRPTLDKQTPTALGEPIYNIIKVSHESSDVFYVASDTRLYRWDGNTFVSICALQGIPCLLGFKDELIICDGGQIKSRDQSLTYLRGAHYNCINELVVNDYYSPTPMSSSGITSVGYVFTIPNDGFRRKMFCAWIYVKQIDPDATGTMKFRFGSGDVTGSGASFIMDSESMDAAGLANGWNLIQLKFPWVATLHPGFTYSLNFDYSGSLQIGTLFRTEYANIPDKSFSYDGSYTVTTTEAPVMSINSTVNVKPSFALTTKSRLLCFGDSEHPARWYYSNVNDADDFSTVKGGGYVTFAADETSKINGAGIYSGSIVVSGIVNNDPQTHVYYGDFPDVIELDKFSGGSTDHWRDVCNTLGDLFFLDRSGILSVKGDIDIGDMRWIPVSRPVWWQMEKDIDWDNPGKRFLKYIPKYGQVWFCPDWYLNQGVQQEKRVYVMHLNNAAWTWFEFKKKVTYVHQIDDDIWVGDEDGHLYKLEGGNLRDDNILIETNYLTAPKIKMPFTNKLFRKFIVDVVGLDGDGNATIKVMKDLNFNPVKTSTMPFPNNQAVDLGMNVKQHQAHIGFSVFQLGISVDKRAVMGPIFIDTVTYGRK